jgi:hypothetical protein
MIKGGLQNPPFRTPKASRKPPGPIIGHLEEVLMMQHMRFRVVGDHSTMEARRWPCREDVRLEAQRRLNASGYTRHRARALATGRDIPDAMRNFAMQVAFVSEKLAALKPIPQNFQSDLYWPTLETEN